MKRNVCAIFILLMLTLFTTACNESQQSGTGSLDDSTHSTLDSTSTDEPPITSPMADTTGKAVSDTSNKANARLTKVIVSVDFDGDGVNEGTKFATEVYLESQIHQIGRFDQKAGIGDDAQWSHELILNDNRIAKTDLPRTGLYLALISGGKDKAKGNPAVTFYYDDGSIITYKYRPFEIGTHDGMSHRTNQPVENW